MMSTAKRPVSRTPKAEQTRAAFADLVNKATERGFFGTASLTLSVQDGHIQQLKVSTERVVR